VLIREFWDNDVLLLFWIESANDDWTQRVLYLLVVVEKKQDSVTWCKL
jgi:hypothetical protein